VTSLGEKLNVSGASTAARLVLLALPYDGCRFHLRHLRILRSRTDLYLGMYPPMTPRELILGSMMAVGLTVYLVYAMLRPEKF
jgi:K+-transporting ATPase KdpF subunit